jgi:GDPmannose 4,6-dehydratase
MKALIIGVTGQDGSLLARHLIQNKVEVHGTFRRGSSDKFWRINEIGIRENIHFHNYNIGNELAFSEVLKSVQPDLIFSFAGESFTSLSFEEPKQFMTVNIESTVEQLEAIRVHTPTAKVFFAGSSEIFGENDSTQFLDESSACRPITPYGISKLTQMHLVRLYREKYNLKVFYGILFPHESEFRSQEFVTRKIAHGLVYRQAFRMGPLQLGDLSMTRDWGSASNYVEWMFKLLEVAEPSEYVFGTGKNSSVEEFLLTCGASLKLNLIRHQGAREGEVSYVDADTGMVYAEADSSRFSANRFSYGASKPDKLFATIGMPRMISLSQLAGQMVESEKIRLKKHL